MIPKKSVLFLVILLAVAVSVLLAEAPIAVSSPGTVRDKIVTSALSYLGRPYLVGGSDMNGFDCSGLVYRVYLGSTDKKVPRTVKELRAFAESIQKSALQKGDLVFFKEAGVVNHVGIYIGEGLFVNAVSDRVYPGVIESSLADAYWSSRFAGAGRLVSPEETKALVFPVTLRASFSNRSEFKGVSASVGLALPVFGMEIGLDLRGDYDSMLGIVRVPAVLTFSPDKTLKIFAGPALTLGTPILDFDGLKREYAAEGGLLAVAGILWTPFSVRIGDRLVGITGEIVYNRYRDVTALPPDAAANAAACIGLGIGLQIR